ncbi:MAG: hypothetical protein RI907_2356 [Pseudomonadota bacterium]|jgi:predicted pyridoxine 5'-phosphate oxidase superfamily flavin-nucleotide-binding protein
MSDDTGDAAPFHPGEWLAQSRAGVRERAEASGRRFIRTHMPEQHRDFFAQLPFIAIGALDRAGQPWASLLMGAPGFMQAPDDQRLQVHALPAPDDPLHGALREGCAVGLLGIELDTRRRNRVNGTLIDLAPQGFALAVSQSFGNCPKYIQPRTLALQAPPPPAPAVRTARHLDARDVAQIQAADTFFIATHANVPDRPRASGADVSHRGGPPGFVMIEADDTLLWPDFMGNGMFNTLGNLQVNPAAGLLFPDFVAGDLLHLAGRSEVIWADERMAYIAGAERLVRFRVDRVRRRPQAWPWRVSAP